VLVCCKRKTLLVGWFGLAETNKRIWLKREIKKENKIGCHGSRRRVGGSGAGTHPVPDRKQEVVHAAASTAVPASTTRSQHTYVSSLIRALFVPVISFQISYQRRCRPGGYIEDERCRRPAIAENKQLAAGLSSASALQVLWQARLAVPTGRPAATRGQASLSSRQTN